MDLSSHRRHAATARCAPFGEAGSHMLVARHLGSCALPTGNRESGATLCWEVIKGNGE
jgi:hypothetical protein